MDAWELPGSPGARRALIYGTAARIGARYGARRLPWPGSSRPLDDGRSVAVKVQYPKVAEIVPREAKDTTRILNLVARFVRGVDLPTISRQLERTILSELDYVNEAANIERFRINFVDEPTVEVPSVVASLSRG